MHDDRSAKEKRFKIVFEGVKLVTVKMQTHDRNATHMDHSIKFRINLC